MLKKVKRIINQQGNKDLKKIIGDFLFSVFGFWKKGDRLKRLFCSKKGRNNPGMR